MSPISNSDGTSTTQTPKVNISTSWDYSAGEAKATEAEAFGGPHPAVLPSLTTHLCLEGRSSLERCRETDEQRPGEGDWGEVGQSGEGRGEGK